MQSSEPLSRVVFALSDFVTYRNLAARTDTALRAMGVKLWLVDPSGRVEPTAG